MCVICVSRKNVRQPNDNELYKMFTANPDGAGFMFVNNHGKVVIRKGFMTYAELLKAVKSERFTAKTPVVYHFRISTQAGVQPAMTQPFPYSSKLEHMRELEIKACTLGIAHNGIIPMTTDRSDKEYSDTARFVAEYLPRIVHSAKDLRDAHVIKMLAELCKSKLALLDKAGDIYTVGEFTTSADGLEFSNMHWNTRTEPAQPAWTRRWLTYTHPIGFDDMPPCPSRK